MRRFIIASHGQLAEGMAHTIEMIFGKRADLAAIGLYIGEQPEAMCAKLEAQIAASPKDEHIIITDLFGGSVNNALVGLCTLRGVHVVSGMNLAMVMSLCLSEPETDTEQCIRTAISDANKNIVYANDRLLACADKKGEDDFYD